MKTEKTNSNKDQKKTETQNNSKGVESWKSFECKNELMFDLEV
jgi:hypothetical protein